MPTPPNFPKYLTLKDVPAGASLLAQHLTGGEILGLFGNLGTGKTLFTKHLAKHLKVKAPVTSPTFTLMNHYTGYLPGTKNPIEILHLDLYRTKSLKEIKALDLFEMWGKKNTLTIIEWAEKLKNHLPPNALILNFKHA